MYFKTFCKYVMYANVRELLNTLQMITANALELGLMKLASINNTKIMAIGSGCALHLQTVHSQLEILNEFLHLGSLEQLALTKAATHTVHCKNGRFDLESAGNS